MMIRGILIAAFFFVIPLGCEKRNGSLALEETARVPFPYEKVAASDSNPAHNGPDDSTELDEMKGGAGKVGFPHFSHASNGKEGFSIPCEKCHHKTAKGKDPQEGCLGCHPVPEAGADPAHGGPDDNLVLKGTLNKAASIPFNHFTHASSHGYKLTCDTCHHTGDRTPCADCHKPLATKSEDGTVVHRSKRAFHLLCKACHKELKKNQSDTKAPTTCKECHRGHNFRTPKEGLTRNRAFHIQCIGCHEAARQNGAGEPPTTNCGGCHTEPYKNAEPTFAQLAGELQKEGFTEAKKEDFVRDPELEKIKGPEHILIDHAKKAKSGTPFPHKKHQDLGDDCYSCHHKGLKDPTCRSCHSDAASAKKAYHESCIPCHKENNIPAGCADCHP